MNEKKMPFGKHKGTPIEKLPRGYVSWILKQEWLKEGWLKDSLMEATAKWTNIKYYGDSSSPWTGWFNSITKRGGSISGTATGRLLY